MWEVPESQIQTLELEVKSFAAQASVSAELPLPTVRLAMEHVLGEVIAELRWKMMGRSQLIIKYPFNWKEALKERFYPKWLLRRWPIQYVTYDVMHVYPDIALPRLGRYFTVAINNRGDQL